MKHTKTLALLLALCLCLGLLTACTQGKQEESTEPTVTLPDPVVPTGETGTDATDSETETASAPVEETEPTDDKTSVTESGQFPGGETAAPTPSTAEADRPAPSESSSPVPSAPSAPDEPDSPLDDETDEDISFTEYDDDTDEDL